MLSNGISEAMNNTAFGLGIAVTCIIAHLFLTAYAKKMVETVELNALKLENLLSRRRARARPSAMDFEQARPNRRTALTGQRHMAFHFSQAQAQVRRRTRRRASSTSSPTSTSS